MIPVTKLQIKFNGTPVGTLSLTADNRLCAFEYERTWLTNGFSLSPLDLPLKPGVFVAKPEPFAGNFGVFEDSLPDGYGRYLLHKILIKQGIDDSTLSALDRLSIIGSGGMGALTYEPITPIHQETVSTDFEELQERALAVLSEKNDDDASLLLFNSMNSGGCRPKALFSDSDGHWLIKFRHTYDPLDIGRQELEYNEAARRCGINVPETKLTNGKYFTVRRFDITSKGERLHTVTAGGLMNISLNSPILDYRNLLALTGVLTRNADDVEEMYRRMVFNYLTDNKDDHCKNFSFYVSHRLENQWAWHLSPAYDLTLCAEGYNGEHATSVNGTGRPTIKDMIEVGTRVKISPKRCLELIAQVKEGAAHLIRYNLK